MESGHQEPAPGRRTIFTRTAFWVFAAALFVGTHWPRLELNVPGVRRPDLIVHFGLFALWYLLLFAAAYMARLGRWRSLIAVWVIAVAYAALDEGLQAIPFVRRNAGWDDFAADVVGVTIGFVIAAVWTACRTRARREQSAS